MPSVSVILPVYNTENYIRESVESILAQSLTDFELIIINDASTDNTLKILQEFTDPRIRLVNNEINLHVVRSLNKGIDLASGEFIARMDADDIAHPNRFEAQIKFLQENPDIDICATWVHTFGEKDYSHKPDVGHEEIKAALLFLNLIIHPSVMFRRRSFSKNGLKYDESFNNAEDYGLWVEAIDILKFGMVPEVLLEYRVHNNNVSVHKDSNWSVIRDINYRVYTTLLNRLGVSVKEEDLELHINLGFKEVNGLSSGELRKYLDWLERLVKANRKSGYFEFKALQGQVLAHVAFLAKKASSTPKRWTILSRSLIRMYSFAEYAQFVGGKVVKKLSRRSYSL